ncbi:MAG: peptidase [Nitrospirales bacterium]|nr:MAG: peptidase [Nitrospirales bacterium]
MWKGASNHLRSHRGIIMIHRPAWVLIHRYIGLVMALFLLVSGLTGSLLAFYDELDTAVNAEVMTVTPPSPQAQPLDPLLVREQVQAAHPEGLVHWVNLNHQPDHARTYFLDSRIDPATGKPFDLEYDTLFVNPYTGEILGARMWGDITQGMTNLMPFLYRLHYALALGTVGEYVFGIVALLWTVDCFIGAYLTFPARARSQSTPHGIQASAAPRRQRHSWIMRWWPSWTMRWKSNRYKVNFDLHRAGGLWPWAMLLILAWSSVGFNLQEVYKPVMGLFFTGQTRVEHVPTLDKPQPEPGIPWAQALEIGQGLMAKEAARKEFNVHEARSLSYDPGKGLYRYSVNSGRDLAEWGGTSVWFDANTGVQRALYLPTGEASGDTVSAWLFALHMAAIWGMPFQIFMSMMGITVAVLSVTGVVIWWKKYTARQQHRIRQKKTSASLPTSHPNHAPAHSTVKPKNSSWITKVCTTSSCTEKM